MLLDDGAQVCEQCHEIGFSGTFCSACGKPRMVVSTHKCDVCQKEGLGTYCNHCGAVLVSPIAQSIDEGTWDWEAWEQQLTPFLGPLSDKELAALAQAPEGR